MIELLHVTKRFGNLTAVEDISLHISAGELFALLGPNAAGKTTTLKILCGLIKPSSGSARLCGYDVQTHPMQARQHLAFVPDFPFLYDKLTPEEFLRFTSRIFRMDADLAEVAIRELIERFHLEPHARKSVDTLSHGTRQRTALAAALLHRPKAIVIDEPMVGLDPQHAKVVKDILRERVRAGAAVLMSIHQLPLAEEMADRIGVIHKGRLVAAGSSEDLRKLSGQNGPLEDIFLALTRETPPSQPAQEDRSLR